MAETISAHTSPSIHKVLRSYKSYLIDTISSLEEPMDIIKYYKSNRELKSRAFEKYLYLLSRREYDLRPISRD